MTRVFLPLGGGNEIGASAYLLLLGRHRLLLDAGMRLRADRVFPDFTPLHRLGLDGLADLDALLITHAHLDHCGALTRVHYGAPRLPIYATAATHDLMAVLLRDALGVTARGEDWHIAEASAERLDAALAAVQPVVFGAAFTAGDTDVRVTAYPAGHILGAAAYLIEAEGKRILHTGDFCLHNQRSIGGATFPAEVQDIDILILESTYAYQPAYADETVLEQQYAVLRRMADVVALGGKVLVPSAALGRGQEVAALLADAFEQGLCTPFPVRVDGLVRPICDCYDNHRPLLPGRLATRPDHVLYGTWVQPMPEKWYPTRAAIDRLPPMCIIASSAMLLDGTRSAHYAEALLPDERNAIMFNGYVDDESAGRRLQWLAQARGRITAADPDAVAATFTLNGRQVNHRAQVLPYRLSAHARTTDLQRTIEQLHPRTVILVHRDDGYASDPAFVQFRLDLERRGIHVQQSANGVPVYL